MIDEVKLTISFRVPVDVEPAGDMPDKWAASLVNNAEIINSRRIAKIPDEGTFITKLANPSSAKFSPMIDASFVSQAGRDQGDIQAAQNVNLASNFNHWNDKLDLAFATVDGIVAKRFKDQVNNSKDNWATEVASKTLRFTGDRVRGLLISQAPFWMTGDHLANQMTNGAIIGAGAPYNFVTAGLSQQFRSAAQSLLVQTGQLILTHNYLPATILAQNARLIALANAMEDAVVVKPFVAGGGAADSIFEYQYNDPNLDLVVQLVEI